MDDRNFDIAKDLQESLMIKMRGSTKLQPHIGPTGFWENHLTWT